MTGTLMSMILQKQNVLGDIGSAAISTNRTHYWIMRGLFGTATVSIQQRALVPHAHDYFQFTFKLGGEDIQVHAAGSTLDLSDNIAVIFNPWESHSVLRNPRGPSLNLILEIEQDWLASLIGVDGNAIQSLFPRPCEELTSEIRMLVLRTATIVCGRLTTVDAKCNDVISELVISLAQSFSKSQVLKDTSNRRRIDSRIRKAVHQIRARAPENPSLEEIAADVGLSRSHFFQQFKLCVGVSPQHFLDWQRMSLAIDKLCRTDASVCDISHQLGFSAPSHFTRFFVQHIGLSPSEYRRVIIDIQEFSGS